MLDDVRRFVQERVEALTPGAAEDLAGALLSRAQGVADQITGLAAGFLAWSSEARSSMLREVRDAVARQIEEMGVATKSDVHRLRERLDRVEARVAQPSAPAPPPRRASSASGTSRFGGSRSTASPTKASTAKASSTKASSSRFSASKATPKPTRKSSPSSTSRTSRTSTSSGPAGT